MDERLPETSWDIIVLGSSSKLSLLAAAFSRAGKRVLQLDPNPYYGSSHASFSLDETAAFINSLPATPSPTTPFYAGTFEILAPDAVGRSRDYTLTLAPHILHWADETLELLRATKMTNMCTWTAVGSTWVYLTPSDLAATSNTPNTLHSLAGDLSAKAVRAATRKKSGWNKNRRAPAATAPTAEPPSGALRTLDNLHEVPCTLEDIAFSATLPDRDRSTLASFLRFAARTPDLTAHDAQLSFADFLAANYPLPPATVASLHALTRLPAPPAATPLPRAVRRLAAHVASLGRIPDARSATALTIAYGGASELAQTLARAAAVGGALNVLGRGVVAHSAGEEGVTATLSSGEEVVAGRLVMAAGCAHACAQSCGVYVVRGECAVLLGRKNEADGIAPAAAVVYFPAGCADLGNEAPVYVQVRGPLTGECRAGEVVVYAVTEDPRGVRAAVEKVVAAEGGEVVVRVEFKRGVDEGGVEWDGERVVQVREGDGVWGDEGWVDECKGVWERVLGEEAEGKGFMRREGMPEVEDEDE